MYNCSIKYILENMIKKDILMQKINSFFDRVVIIKAEK